MRCMKMVRVFDINLADAQITQLEIHEYQLDDACVSTNSDRPTSASNDSLNRTFFIDWIFYRNLCKQLLPQATKPTNQQNREKKNAANKYGKSDKN